MNIQLRAILISVFSIFTFQQSFSQSTICYHQDKLGAFREKNVKFTDLDLSVKLIEKQARVEGKANFTFDYLRKEIDTLFLDAIEFDVHSLTINGQSVKYSVDSAGITIYLPENRTNSSTMSIQYACHPVKGMYFLNWNNPDTKARRQIWTQGQGIDNRHWIPCIDNSSELMTVATHITFNENYEVVSNGEFQGKTSNGDGTQTWNYKMNYPHTPYLIMIAAGDFKYKTMTSSSGIKIDQYYYPDHEDWFEPTYRNSADMMDWFEDEIGVDYAWGKIYRNVPTKDFIYGAMENTTSTIFADYMHTDARGQLERAYEGVNAHELAHQWFGDLVTEKSGQHHWLHESFATHYSKKYMEYKYGKDVYEATKVREANSSFWAGQKNSLPVAHMSSGSARHYPKGSFVLQMMRDELGNENYRRVIKSYLEKFYHKGVETNDLYASIYEVTGRNIDWFFDQWIKRGGEPKLEVSFTQEKDELTLNINQVQEIKDDVYAFRLPMKTRVFYKDGTSEVFDTEVRELKETIKLKVRNTVSGICVDENMDFLRKIEYLNKNNNRTILKYSENSVALMEAVNRMKEVDWSKKKDLFLNVYHQATSPLVKSAIISTSEGEGDIAQDIVMHGLKDASHRVRRSAIFRTSALGDAELSHLMGVLEDSSYKNVEFAAKKILKNYPEKREEILSELKGQKGYQNNLEILYHATIVSDPTDSRYDESIKALTYLSSEASGYRERISAMNILYENEIYNEEIAYSLIQGSMYHHGWIRGESVKYLNSLKKEKPQVFLNAVKNYPFTAPRKTQQKLFEILNSK